MVHIGNKQDFGDQARSERRKPHPEAALLDALILVSGNAAGAFTRLLSLCASGRLHHKRKQRAEQRRNREAPGTKEAEQRHLGTMRDKDCSTSINIAFLFEVY